MNFCTDTETFSNSFSNDDMNDDMANVEMQYAAYYDEKWFIGRIINKVDSFKMKFLRDYLEEYVWPKEEDSDTVNKIHIIYGPVNMIGCEPLNISKSDRCEIEKKYK